MTQRRPLSVRARLLICLVTANLLLVGLFALCTIMYIRRELLQAFDETLKANAEAVRALVDVDDRRIRPGMTIPVEVMSRFRKSRRPDLFAVLYGDGAVLAKSEILEDLPDFVRRVDNPRVREFQFGDDTYRGIVLPLDLPHAYRASDDDDVEVIAFFASAREDLDEELEDAIEYVLVAGGGVLVFSFVTAWLVARASLRPFAVIAAQTAQIDESKLHRRFDTDALPPDLVPFGRSLNSLLQRLESAFQREKRFSADAAHELRTPVASLKAGIQAAQLSPRDAAEDARLLTELLDDTARLEELCEALLTTATAEAPREAEPRIPAGELQGLLGAVAAEFSASARAAGHELEVKPFPPLPDELESRTDPIVVRRIVSNLLANALRHGGPNLHVAIEATAGHDDSLRIEVQDNGVGIPPESRGKIFERFFRHEGSRSRIGGGAGLGLAICRKLAERDGGRIEYRPREGGGSVFRWTIAAAERLEKEG